MNIIITSFTFIPSFIAIFNESNIQYKFLLYDDIIKKIKKNYLKKSKIVFVYHDQYDKIKYFKKLIKNYNNEIQILFIDTSSFFLNDTSTFFINEFLHSNFHLNDLQKCFKKKNQIIIPNIFIHKINKTVIITGICRNVSKYIFNSFHKFLYLTKYFKKSKIIIYENDSNDNTLDLLYDYKNKYTHIEIIILSEINIHGSITQRISHGRNKILNYIKFHQFEPDYLINIDMDDILLDFKCDSILYPFNEKIEWSMFGGNSNIYYDMWALRTLNEPNKDFWEDKKKNNKYTVPINKILESYFIVDQESSPIPVYSCFNGIGIYKYKHIINCVYDGDTTCEHIHFHDQMVKFHKAKLFIHPKLLVGPHKILGKSMNHYKINKLVKKNL